MNDLRQAAQQALEALEEATSYTSCTTWSPSMTEECETAAAALRAALAQQAEPVEPVAYRHLHEDGWEYHDAPTGEDCAECQALYTAPPQRKPLTEEEIAELARQEQFLLVCDGLEELTEIARAVERAHKIGEEK